MIKFKDFTQLQFRSLIDKVEATAYHVINDIDNPVEISTSKHKQINNLIQYLRYLIWIKLKPYKLGKLIENGNEK
ncbi:hypothetical protein DERF_004579 [Dermatophagoides farinae]|uniref:Uncharacterized protein n=1 Tax=Dermatophagoides farinae TaxID=6954 RepID=A0A922L6C4_DERFA|nr:hypothetical protein DERF_004579 [Dermatophagoides farinae]